ncbi:MAG: hypothetical protein IPO36_18780 [Anaerolineales bacterium]|nr:hypothetical protein [Anaerolineales bacterium]
MAKGKFPPASAACSQAACALLWDHLSAERKLDVVGILLAFIGVVIILGLVSLTHSEPIEKYFPSSRKFSAGAFASFRWAC